MLPHYILVAAVIATIVNHLYAKKAIYTIAIYYYKVSHIASAALIAIVKGGSDNTCPDSY
jgi:hypothetical protein